MKRYGLRIENVGAEFPDQQTREKPFSPEAKLEALYEKISDDMRSGGLSLFVKAALMDQLASGRLHGDPVYNFLDGFHVGAFAIARLLQSGKMSITTLEIDTPIHQAKATEEE